jgi:hypothetical protein
MHCDTDGVDAAVVQISKTKGRYGHDSGLSARSVVSHIQLTRH